MSRRALSFLCLLMVSLSSCSDFGTNGSQDIVLPRPLTSLEKQTISSANEFSFKLLSGNNTDETTKNVFISPLSISMALGMTFNGANGTTKDAMQQTLEFRGLTPDEINQSYKGILELLINLDTKVQLMVANSIWYRPTLNVEQEFISTNKKYFNAEVARIDFGDPNASNTINSWVEKSTKGKITNIVPATIPSDAMMYLINAIYFKGDWKYKFSRDATRDDLFTTVGGDKKPVRMMYQKGDFAYLRSDRVAIVDLPYGGSAFSMTILLPEIGIDIDAFTAQLTSEKWVAWVAGLQVMEGEIFLPKFKIEYEKSLKHVLARLGMEIAFTETADFTNIDRRGNLYITEVKHKSFVQVDEEGTTAAAATSVEISVTSMRGFVFRVDRPFIFVIRENLTGTIVFMGKITDPS